MMEAENGGRGRRKKVARFSRVPALSRPTLPRLTVTLDHTDAKAHVHRDRWSISIFSIEKFVPVPVSYVTASSSTWTHENAPAHHIPPKDTTSTTKDIQDTTTISYRDHPRQPAPDTAGSGSRRLMASPFLSDLEMRSSGEERISGRASLN